MNRRACALLLVVLPLLLGASVTTEVSLDQTGGGLVYVVSRATFDEANRLTYLSDPHLRDLFLIRQMVASPMEVKRLFTVQGFSDVVVQQDTKGNLETQVTARISDVRPLLTVGGALDLSEKPGNFLDLDGSIGGGLAGESVDLTPLKDVHVTLRFRFQGTVRGVGGGAAEVSHVRDAVTYRWTADRLLGGSTRVHVRIVPNVEGAPYFWLALIVGVTVLVVFGAYLVLRHGRQALPGTER
jgi:hypothetical protein